jgi:Putative adhesin
VLILIGLAFLLHTHFPIGYLFRTYWPLLLILWGVVKLVETISARRSAEGARPFMTGGEVVLLVLFLLIAGMVSTFDRLHEKFPDMDFGDVWSDRGSPVTDDLPVRKVTPNAPISIKTARGDITIFADREDDMQIVATKTVRAGNDDESRRRGRQIVVNVNAEKNGYDVEPEINSRASRTRVDFEVHLPKNVNLTLETEHGDIVANDIKGPVTATSQNGSVEIHDTQGNVTATVQSGGDVRVSNITGDVHLMGRGNNVDLSNVQGNAAIDGEFLGSIEVDNVSETMRYASSRTDLTLLHLQGRLEMDSGSLQISDTTGSVKLNTRNRDVEIDNVSGRIDVNDAHGDISVSLKKAPKDEISIGNDSGAVDVSMPSNSSFEISAASKSGEINSDFEAGTLNQTNQEESSSLTGHVGTRGPKISINTSYGTISLRKSDS